MKYQVCVYLNKETRNVVWLNLDIVTGKYSVVYGVQDTNYFVDTDFDNLKDATKLLFDQIAKYDMEDVTFED